MAAQPLPYWAAKAGPQTMPLSLRQPRFHSITADCDTIRLASSIIIPLLTCHFCTITRHLDMWSRECSLARSIPGWSALS